MSAPYPPEAVANFFIGKACDDSISDMTPMKVLKLVYIAHGWHLGYMDAPLINSEIQAWRYGPVVQGLYHLISHYKDGSIKEKIQVIDPSSFDPSLDDTSSWDFKLMTPEIDTQQDLKNLLDSVWDCYKNMTGMQLSNLTHLDGTPWDKTQRSIPGDLPYGLPIPNALIKQYYKDRITHEN